MSEAMELKRAGFVGMRGKKNLENLWNDLYDTEPMYPEQKRSGFVGMRGKKSEPSDEAFNVAEPMFFTEKRAGFVGMRGKKFQSLPLDVSI